jgi:ATP-dependent Lon protease
MNFQGHTITSTADVEIPKRLIDQIIGQDQAVEVVRIAARQRRFLLIVGEPGTGKSLLGQAVAEMFDKQPLQDVLALPNFQEAVLPKVQVCAAGEATVLVQQAKHLRRCALSTESFILWALALSTLCLALYFAIRDNSPTWILGGVFVLFLIYQGRKALFSHSGKNIPKILISNSQQKVPFIDATGSQAGALLGDVRHDPFQSGGHESSPHSLLEAGAIHRAHNGVLFIDEVSTLGMDSQQSLLTAIQQKELAIFGRSPGSSGTMVRSENVPCDFLLILAGNVEDIDNMHPALRSRVRGYGYEIFTNTEMADTAGNCSKLIQFIAQEVKRDGKIPHFDLSAIEAIIAAARKRASQDNMLTTKLRELGGLVRAAGDLAVQLEDKLVSKKHVELAHKYARSLEEQQDSLC